MNNYIAVVFPSENRARTALRTLWDLDDIGDITIHGAAVVRRDDLGNVRVAEHESDLGNRTAVGVGIGALLGLLAGPVGMAVGAAGAAAVVTGTAVGVGALTGGVIGGTADIVTDVRRNDAVFGSLFALRSGESAIVAEVSEDWTSEIDEPMKALGGVVHRRKNNAETNAAFGPDFYTGYLYPYYYEPRYY